MNIIKKYYDAEPEQQYSGSSDLNIPGIMAQLGQVNNGGSNESNSSNWGNNSESTESTEMVDNSEDGYDYQEGASQGEQNEGYSQQTQIVEDVQQEFNLQEVLRQQQPDFILKELGYDDDKIGFIQELKDLDPKMVNFLNLWKANGDVTGYLKELSTDYSKMPVEEVMRHQLRQEYPQATERQLELLFKKEVIDAYGIDPDVYSDDEVEAGRELLEAKAAKFRSSLVEKQQSLLLPEAPQNQTQVDDGSAYMEIYKENVTNNSLTQSMYSTGQISVGEGDTKFNFAVNPNEVTELLYDSNKWSDALFDKYKDDKGNDVIIPNVEHQMLVATVAKYGNSFIDALAKHYISIGAKKVIDPIDNPSNIGGSAPSRSTSEPTSIAGMMAKRGMIR